MKHSIHFILIFVIYHSLAHAQQMFKGYVVNAFSREPVAGAVIHAASGKAIAIADLRGQFSLPAVVDSITISCVGYQTVHLVHLPANGIIYLTPEVTILRETVVSASREGEQRSTVPAAISVISSRMIAQTHAITLDQLLNQVSGVYMVDLGNEQHTMAIRQPIGYRNVYLYLENGIPIRTVGDFNHNALIEMNSAAVKHIEIIRGPGSSLYGSDAIGGVINFITRTPAVIPTGSVSIEGSSIGYKRFSADVSGTARGWGIGLAGYYANQHDTYHQHNDFHKLALTLRADRVLSTHSKWTNELTWVNYYSDMNGGLDSLDFYQKNYASYYTFNYRKVSAVRYTSSLYYGQDTHSSGFVSAYYHDNDVEQNPSYRIKRTSDPLKASGEINDNIFHTFGLLSQHSWQLRPEQLQVIAGLNGEYSPFQYHANYIQIQKNQAGYYISYTPTDSLLSDYRAGIYTYAAYVQLKWQPVSHLYLVGGLRGDGISYHFVNNLPPSAYTGAPSSTNSFGHITPKIGLNYSFSSNLGGYLNFSQGFAPPDITDLYNGVKVPYLKPATYQNYEAGLWWSFWKDKILWQADVYRMTGTHEIISVRQDDGSYQNANAGKTLHYGVEYAITCNPVSDIQFKWNGTWARHRFIQYQINGKDYSHHEMNAAPHLLYYAELSYRPAFLKQSHIAFSCEHVGKYYIDPANTQIYGGYTLLNIRLGYQWQRLSMWLHVWNVMNTIYATTVDYASYGNTYRAGIPRTWQLGLGYDFSRRIQASL